MMRIVLLALLLPALTQGFAPSFGTTRRASLARSALRALNDDNNNNNDDNDNEDGSDFLVDRRNLFAATAASTLAAAAFLTVTVSAPTPALALDYSLKKVVVAGSTGQTGRRILERLASIKGLSVIAGVRDITKAKAALEESSTVIRGAMVQQVAGVDIDTSAVDLKHLDVVKDSVDELAATLQGAEALIIATGFIPGNPLKMNEQAHLVDNIGACRLMDAAAAAGVKKVVMVSSILTNGRNWGQEKSPGFIITNAFGQVLDEKIVAENHLRALGLDYTIVRPGGLKAKPPTGALVVSGEDTLSAGEISRDLVADVCVAALTDPKASNKVLEIVEAEEGGPKVFNGLNM